MLDAKETFETVDCIQSDNLEQEDILGIGRNAYDSDHIDSDIEAELYSQLHHESLEVNEGKSKRLKKLITKKKKATKIVTKTYCDSTSRNSKPKKVSPKSSAGPTKKSLACQSWPVIGSHTPLRTKIQSSVSFSVSAKLGLVSKMTDSECEIIRIGPDDKKVIPLVVVSDSSSENDCVIEKTVFNASIDVKINFDKSTPIDPEKSNKGKSRKKKKLSEKDPNEKNNRNRAKKRKIEEEKSENWEIDTMDKYPFAYRSTQKYKHESAMNRMQCYNCRQHGHHSRSCKSPKRFVSCYQCGAEGHHGDRCINPVCTKCLLIGHSNKYCHWEDEYLQIDCPICKLPGHLREECPDTWRRFHLTVVPGNIVRLEGKQLKDSKHCWCYNCGRIGHMGLDCSREKVERNLYPSCVYVSSYADPMTQLRGNKYISKLPKEEDLKLKSIFQYKARMAKLSNEKFSRVHGVPTLRQAKTMQARLRGQANQDPNKTTNNSRRKEQDECPGPAQKKKKINENNEADSRSLTICEQNVSENKYSGKREQTVSASPAQKNYIFPAVHGQNEYASSSTKNFERAGNEQTTESPQVRQMNKKVHLTKTRNRSRKRKKLNKQGKISQQEPYSLFNGVRGGMDNHTPPTETCEFPMDSLPDYGSLRQRVSPAQFNRKFMKTKKKNDKKNKFIKAQTTNRKSTLRSSVK